MPQGDYQVRLGAMTPVPIVTIILQKPTMAQDNKIAINTAMPNNPLLQPGLRLGDWSQVQE